MNYFNSKDNNTFEKGFKRFLRNLLYLLISLPLGIIYFTIAVSGISLGLGLSIVYVGIPIIAITLICAKEIVDFEKNMAVKILNADINMSEGVFNSSKDEEPIKRTFGVIKTLKNWKSICYCIIKLPISIIHFS